MKNRNYKFFGIGICCFTGLISILSSAKPITGWYPDTGDIPVESDTWGNGDAFSRPAVDRQLVFQTLGYCYLTESVSVGAQRYNKNELFLIDDPKADRLVTRWTINPKTTTRAELGIKSYILRPPASISVRIKNNSTKELIITPELFEVKTIRDCPSASWLLTQQTLQPGEEKELTFDYNNYRCRQGKQTERPDRPLFPATASLIITGLQEETDNELVLKEYTVSYSSPERPIVSGLTVPDRVFANGEMTIDLAVRGTVPLNGVLDLEAENCSRVMWRIRLSNEQKQQLAKKKRLQIVAPVPWYLNEGDYRLNAVLNGYRIKGVSGVFKVENDRQPGFPTVERKVHNGQPAMFVNGKPEPWWGYAGYKWQPGNATAFAKDGSTTFCIATTIGAHLHQILDSTWIAPGKYDYSQINEYM
ncbi:MAG: hypothetical protein WC959_01520 [Kiritimatiellales bacterium]